MLTQMSGGAVKEKVVSGLSARVVNNPSKTHFTLITSASKTLPLQVRVTDNMNRLVEIKSGLPANGTMRLGSSLKPGIYFVEVIQEGRRVTLKLAKM
jgi:hypothetical protein